MKPFTHTTYVYLLALNISRESTVHEALWRRTKHRFRELSNQQVSLDRSNADFTERLRIGRTWGEVERSARIAAAAAFLLKHCNTVIHPIDLLALLSYNHLPFSIRTRHFLRNIQGSDKTTGKMFLIEIELT